MSGSLGEFGESVHLSRETRDRYQQLAGKQAYGLIRMAIEAPGWDKIPDFQKAQTINTFVSIGREANRPAGDVLPKALDQFQKRVGGQSRSPLMNPGATATIPAARSRSPLMGVAP